MDTARVRTRTIWLAAAVVFGIGVIASLISGSVILAIFLILVTVGCVVAARRVPPDADGTSADDEEHDQDEKDEKGEH